MSPALRRLLLLPILLLALLAGWAHDRVLEQREQFPDDVDVLYVPPPAHLQVMSLGYKEALADLLWIRALIFSGARIGETDIGAVSRYVDAITGLAPRFHRIYVWGGVTPVYGGGAVVTRPMVDQSIATYRRGLEHFPESHQILYPLGMMLTHQVSSTPGYSEEEKEALAAEGIEYIRRAAAFGADPLVRQYAATLVADHGTEELARQFLESELAQADDEGFRRMLRYRLRKMGGSTSVERIEQTRDDFLTELSQQMPYATDTLYAVIRDEHAQPRDEETSQTP